MEHAQIDHDRDAGAAVAPGAGWRIRAGLDSDGQTLVALIWSCWSVYPGIQMDVDREMPELHALATHYRDDGGALWVAETGGAVSGMIAVRPLQARVWEICRVYVDPALHGSGLGHALLDQAERYAIASGADRLALWSDTRFGRAHRFYEKRSYVRDGPVRVLNDISNSLEYGYAKPIEGIESLDIAAATSAVRRLAEILIASVGDGASISFREPLTPANARAFWQRAASEVAAGKRIILAAWQDGILAGAGMLDRPAEVQEIIIDPNRWERGLRRQILRALEKAAGA